MSTITCKQYPKVFIYIYHILYFCIPLLYPRAATSSAKNCPSDLTSKGYLRLLGSASTRSGFIGLFLTYPASALSPRPTCLADPMLLQFFSHLRRSYPAERRPCHPTGRRTPPQVIAPLLGATDAAAWRHRRRRLAPPTPPYRGSAFSVLASRCAPPLPAMALHPLPLLGSISQTLPSQHGSLGAAKPVLINQVLN